MAQPQVNTDTLPKSNPYSSRAGVFTLPKTMQPAIVPEVEQLQGDALKNRNARLNQESIQGLKNEAGPLAASNIGKGVGVYSTARTSSASQNTPTAPAAPTSPMGPSLAGITTQRPFMTSDEDFNRPGSNGLATGFSDADKEIINARIRERQAGEQNTSTAVGPHTARTVDAQGRTTYSGIGEGGSEDPFSFSDQLARLKEIDPQKYGSAAPQEAQKGVDFSSFPMTIEGLMRRKQAIQNQDMENVQRKLGIEQQHVGVLANHYGDLARKNGTRTDVDVANAEYLREQTAAVKQKTASEAARQQLLSRMADEKDPVAKVRLEKYYDKYYKTFEAMADGGEVPGFADGGAIGARVVPAPRINPTIAQYGQYLQAASQSGVAPVPFEQYMNLLSQSRNTLPEAHYADGGDVSALGRPLKGPGTGRSDSIPAVIDGIEPAALSKGEFVFDAETTKYYGTKFLKDLQRKAQEAATAEGQPNGA